MEDDHAVGLEQSAQVIAVAEEKLGRNWFVAHAPTSRYPLPQGNPDFEEIAGLCRVMGPFLAVSTRHREEKLRPAPT